MELMNPTNLRLAHDRYQDFMIAMREAHTDSVNSDNTFAEMALYKALGQATKLEQELARLRFALDETLQPS